MLDNSANLSKPMLIMMSEADGKCNLKYLKYARLVKDGLGKVQHNRKVPPGNLGWSFALLIDLFMSLINL